MNMFATLVLVAATTTGGIHNGPDVGGKRFLRHHAVVSGDPPPGGPLDMNAMRASTAGLQPGRRFPSVRSQIYFVDPAGMNIGWQASSPGGEKVYLNSQLVVPARYNFLQGYIYRLKLTNVPKHEGLVLYPTIEVAPSTPATDAYLTHNPIPCQFTEEDFDQVTAGNFVTKVIYLPDPKYQELAIAGVETLVSTRLEPGVDPILEADRRGTILMIIRLGAIDLEMPGGGAIMPGPNGRGPVPAPAAGGAPMTTVPITVAPPTTESVPLEGAPVSPLSAPPANATTPPVESAPPPAAAPETPPAEAPKAM